MRINLIVLAAGTSRRFGSNKLLYELNNKRMFEYILDEIVKEKESIFAKIIVVTQYDEIKEYAQSNGLHVVMNANSNQGISTSIHLGILHNEADAYVFVVADQPYLSYKTIKGLVNVFCTNTKTMGSVCSSNRVGNPTIFSNCWRHELLQLTADQGGRKLLIQSPNDVVYYYVEDEKELMDVDYLPSEIKHKK